jgi:hypothetical protein
MFEKIPDKTAPVPARGRVTAVPASDTRVKQFLPDAKIRRLGRPGKLRGNQTENVFLSWLGWLHQYFDDFSILLRFHRGACVPPKHA